MHSGVRLGFRNVSAVIRGTQNAALKIRTMASSCRMHCKDVLKIAVERLRMRIHHNLQEVKAGPCVQASANSYHVLQYQYVDGILEKRGPYRAAHLDGAQKMVEQNKLVMAGALSEPVDGALFIFRNLSKPEIEEFAKADPYVINGLVPSYSIRPYMVVVGDTE